MVKEDRGPLDLTLLIEEKDKEIAELKKDNKNINVLFLFSKM